MYFDIKKQVMVTFKKINYFMFQPVLYTIIQ